MKKTFFLSSLMALSAFAGDELEERVSLLECKMKTVCNETVYGADHTARFANGRPMTTGYGCWGTAEVLYWKTFEGGTDLAASNSTTLANLYGHVSTTNFDWEVGYRIGFSYAWPQDNWDLSLLFTRINPNASTNQIARAGETFVSLLTPDVNNATSFNSTWDVKLSVLDYEMGRSYFMSRYFYVRPFFGARGAWIHQKATGRYANAVGGVEFINKRNDFDGGGLRFGADTKWFFDKHWNFSFSTSTSGLWGHFKVSHISNFTYASTGFSNQYAASFSRFVVSAEALLGLGWETMFAQDRNHLSLMIGYELSYWWRQNQLPSFENNQARPYGDRYSDDLSFHGVTFDAQISF